jgi:AcrR family transcriptional regulator
MLNMRSTPADDATTRSRIRDAAIALFGRDGFAATSVRAIAESAGVSAALVIHHFGSKEGLRRACDEHVVAALMARKDDLTRDANPSAAMQQMLADAEAYRPTLDYLARMILDGSELGDELFDALVANSLTMLEDGVANGMMRPSSDPEVRAIVVTTQSLSTLLLERQIGRALGASGLTADVVRRLTLPTLELYTHGLYTDDTLLAAAAEALARTSGPQSNKGPGNPNQDPDPPRSG